MEPELINFYIESLLREIEELTKNRILLQTQVRYKDSIINSLNKQLEELQSELNGYDKRINKDILNKNAPNWKEKELKGLNNG